MTMLIKRNLRIFFRDRSAVFFSLMASFVIVGLYVLFLGDVWTSNFKELENARELMDNWVMAGLLATTSVTTTLGAFGIMVNDKAQKIQKDFYSSPASRTDLALGYVGNAVIIGFLMSLVTLALAELYIVAEGGALLSLASLLKVLLAIVAADLTNTAMMLLIVSFIESTNAFSTASSVIGTLIGFITGIYLPIGMLPGPVQWIVRLFPTSHAALVFRQIMMEGPMKDSLANIPSQYITQFKDFLGLTYRFGDRNTGCFLSIVILLICAVVFFILASIRLSRKKA